MPSALRLPLSLPRGFLASAVLASGGAALFACQYVASRELGSTFFVTELSLLLATLITLLGPSLGYALGGRLTLGGSIEHLWAAVAFLAHATLPWSIRALSAALSTAHPAWALILATVLITIPCGYCAVLLPLYAKTDSLPRLYAAELAGALIFLVGIALGPSYQLLRAGYLLVPVVMALLRYGRKVALGTLLGSATLIGLGSHLDQHVTAAYFRHVHGIKSPQLLASDYSPHQRIDVVRDDAETALFLDGVPFYRSGSLDAFSVLLAEVPGAMRSTRGHALVVGSGSFSSAARLHRLGYRVQVIELDARVASLGFAHFASVHRLSPHDITLTLDDARHALAHSTERFDLIVLDVPAPYRIATALLHTPTFYRQVAEHLTPGGVVSLSLCEALSEPLAQRIAQSAAQVFADILVVDSSAVGLPVLYAARKLPFSPTQVEQAVTARDPQGAVLLFADAQVRRLIHAVRPLSDRDLLGVLLLARHAYARE